MLGGGGGWVMLVGVLGGWCLVGIIHIKGEKSTKGAWGPDVLGE